jgi:predicted acyltransferase
MTASTSPRLTSLDQFRGYTVAGMFLVNFLGGYKVIDAYLPLLKHHHTFCSYADTIMPQFFFAVGFAYRMTMLRRLATAGRLQMFLRVLRRCLGLILLGFVIHHLDAGPKTWAELEQLGLVGFLRTAFQRSFFQTLTHIGITSLWVLPVITASAWVRIGFMVLCGAAHVAISSAGYYDWVIARPGIDGGPLGFLTWTIPLLVGSLAFDILRGEPNPPAPFPTREEGEAARGEGEALAEPASVNGLHGSAGASPSHRSVGRLLLAGAGVMLLGYALSCLSILDAPDAQDSALSTQHFLAPPPFVQPASPPKSYWVMSQRAGSAPYLAFGAGFSLVVFAVFVLLCDGAGWQLGLFRTLGGNALAAYVIHDLVMDAVKPWTPRDAPAWFVFAAFGCFFAISYLCVRFLERQKLYLRL